MIDDMISGIIHVNHKSKIQRIGHKIDFPIYKLNSKHNVSCIWYSNISKTSFRSFELSDFKSGKYHKYIDTEIVNVDRIKDIPDYPGIMGVPISILVYPQDQFEILGKAANTTIEVDGKRINKFERILIKKK